MDLSNIYNHFSHTKILKHDYLNFNKGGKMKKILIILSITTLLSGNAIAGYSYCTTSCYGNSCTTYCYEY